MATPYVTYEEQDELGSELVRARENKVSRKRPYVDVVALAESFGLVVQYDNFAEADSNKDGFLANGIDPLKVWRDKKRVDVVFPEGTIVIENYLKAPGKETKLRFTIAHEIAHHINNIHQHESSFHSQFDPEMTYTHTDLQKLFSIREAQADNLAGILLTPTYKLQEVFKKITGGEFLTMYGDRTVDADTMKKITEMATEMRVSYTTIRIRLEKLGMFVKKPISKYIEGDRFNLDYPSQNYYGDYEDELSF